MRLRSALAHTLVVEMIVAQWGRMSHHKWLGFTHAATHCNTLQLHCNTLWFIEMMNAWWGRECDGVQWQVPRISISQVPHSILMCILMSIDLISLLSTTAAMSLLGPSCKRGLCCGRALEKPSPTWGGLVPLQDEASFPKEAFCTWGESTCSRGEATHCCYPVRNTALNQKRPLLPELAIESLPLHIPWHILHDIWECFFE